MAYILFGLVIISAIVAGYGIIDMEMQLRKLEDE